MYKLDTLPDWMTCKDAVDAGAATPLQRYIYNNEPAGQAHELVFRQGLVELLNEVTANAGK